MNMIRSIGPCLSKKFTSRQISDELRQLTSLFAVKRLTFQWFANSEKVFDAQIALKMAPPDKNG